MMIKFGFKDKENNTLDNVLPMLSVALPDDPFSNDGVDEILKNMFGDVPILEGANLGLGVPKALLVVADLGAKEEVPIFKAGRCFGVGGGKSFEGTTRTIPLDSGEIATDG